MLILLLVPSCATRHRSTAADVHLPDNVYKTSPYLPPDLRRVAVLPITVERGDWEADAGREQIEPVLHEELGRVKKFELIIVTAQQLELWTGKGSWQADEKLPALFLAKLREKLECDGVLFSHLRPYHAFHPMVLGWNLKLVDVRRQAILWSAEETYDAAQPPTAAQAKRFENGSGWRTWFSSDSGSILLSPRQFSQFTLNNLLATLPER
ncbi:MAG: hypothetical protein QOF48_3829 [Verrucomicrobiota bacterium]